MEIGTTEAAARLGIKPARVRQLIYEGLLPARKVNDDWLIQPSHLARAAVRERPKPGRPKRKGNGK